MLYHFLYHKSLSNFELLIDRGFNRVEFELLLFPSAFHLDLVVKMSNSRPL